MSVDQLAPGQFLINPGDEVELWALCRFKQLMGSSALFILPDGEELYIEQTDLQSGNITFRLITECPWKLNDVVRDEKENIFIWRGGWSCITDNLVMEPVGVLQLVNWVDGIVVKR